MPASMVVVTPVFEQAYAITLSAAMGGSATSDPAGVALAGQTVTLTAVPVVGFEFDGWEVIEGGVTLSDTTPATFTMPAQEVEIAPSFRMSGAPAVKEEPYLLFFATDGKLSAGAWESNVSMNNLLYFKFGSIVGSVAKANDAYWSPDRLRFDPTRISPTKYEDIPYAMNGGVYMNDGEGYYSSDEYNTAVNFKAGKGDPCRLVGLTAEMVKTMSNAGLEAYDSGLRLMSRAEAQRISGERSLSRTDHMVTYPFIGAVLPHSGDEPYDASKFMPAAGFYRGNIPVGQFVYAGYPGQSGSANAYGRYWQDTAVNVDKLAYALMFGSDVDNPKAIDPNFDFQPAMSCPIRCMVKE
jgi:hypothetical protein